MIQELCFCCLFLRCSPNSQFFKSISLNDVRRKKNKKKKKLREQAKEGNADEVNACTDNEKQPEIYKSQDINQALPVKK